MQRSELEQMLFDSAAEVLETMFFTSLMGYAAPEICEEEWISGTLSFRGTTSGRFGVRLPPVIGRKLAASFLGVDKESLSELQTGEVICELANMLCGSVLSRLEKETRFELHRPELGLKETGCRDDGRKVCRVLQLEDGPLAMWLELE